ncbi:MAG TPA: carbohydrate ABC transporter permease [Anaerolineales bacterium]|nr:carbohydrate ABC transporter permease [Anaerolineales bacterium]
MNRPLTSDRYWAFFRRLGSNILLYFVLLSVAVLTIFPFVWILFTSFKGPNDPIVSVPIRLLPQDPTFANYIRVWSQLPIGRFYLNSILVSFGIVILNTLFSALAAYPLAKMKFRGREAIFYSLLATFIVPPVLTSIPSFILAVKVFRYYDQLSSVIFPYLAGVINIFLLRQAFKGVPDDLIDAGRIDGAGELRIWWSILLPVIRPSLATVAIITFVEQWNNFFWPSLMLHTDEHMTLQVGLVALQGAFLNDARGIAAGVVMTIVPMILFFMALQRQFIQGLTGAVKG